MWSPIYGALATPVIAIIGGAVGDLVDAHDRKVQRRLLRELERLGYKVPDWRDWWDR